MKRDFLSIVLAGFAFAGACGVAECNGGAGYFRGMCDASAVVPLNDDLFVVADDEDNFLRTYSLNRGGMPVDAVNVSRFLGFRKSSGETDLEGAARIGDRIYWISSHGRNSAAKAQPRRQRFFATTAQIVDGRPLIRPVGVAYVNLLRDLVREPRLAKFNLAAASRGAPKEEGSLNIEGLVATPEGHLLIGFRNPIPEGRALVVPLLNPAEVVSGRPVRFGDPMQVDFDGLGIRAMTPWRDGYLVIAGDSGTARESRLYRWDGHSASAVRLSDASFAGFNPEAIAVLPKRDDTELLMLSDDGAMPCGGIECKQLKDPLAKRFRHRVLKLPFPIPDDTTGPLSKPPR